MFCCFKTTKTEEEASASGIASEKETPRYNGQAKYVVAKTCLADDYPTVKQEDNTAARSSAQGERQPRLELGAGRDQGRRRLEPEFEVEAPRSENVGAPSEGVAVQATWVKGVMIIPYMHTASTHYFNATHHKGGPSSPRGAWNSRSS
ncbi:hypothetical protein QJQ45_003630 [Haematococcus lacustris]|nr:hypothetical protein QJQ45_003630 [Haematococcus lacustris]